MARTANTVEITTDPDTKEIVFTLVGADESGTPRSYQQELNRVDNEESVNRLSLMYLRKRKFKVKDKRSFKEYYYSKKKKLTEDDKEKEDDKKKIKDSGGRDYGSDHPLAENDDNQERIDYLQSRTNELARQYMSKGLKSADAINAAYAQAEREWSSQEQDAIKAVKQQYKKQTRR